MQNKQKIVNDDIALYQILDADFLVDLFRKDELRGKLKQIASELYEEDNPVIMLVKHKK